MPREEEGEWVPSQRLRPPEVMPVGRRLADSRVVTGCGRRNAGAIRGSEGTGRGGGGGKGAAGGAGVVLQVACRVQRVEVDRWGGV